MRDILTVLLPKNVQKRRGHTVRIRQIISPTALKADLARPAETRPAARRHIESNATTRNLLIAIMGTTPRDMPNRLRNLW